MFRDATRERVAGTIAGLRERGAQGIVFGCTEIGLLLSQDHCPLPILDTTLIHAMAAVDFALG